MRLWCPIESDPEQESFPLRSSTLPSITKEGSYWERIASLLQHRSMTIPGREIDQVDTLSWILASPHVEDRDDRLLVASTARGGSGAPPGSVRSQCDRRGDPPVLSGRPGLRNDPGCEPVARAGPQPQCLEVLSRLQRSRRHAAPERREPCPGRPVGRGDRDLPADHRPVRRQGRRAAQGRDAERAGDRRRRIRPVRRSEGLLPPVAGQAAARGQGDLPEPRGQPGRALVPRGAEPARYLGAAATVVDLAFCSSWGDDALELLGDLAFQDGRFGEALSMYRQLVLDRPDDTFSLVHPDPASTWPGSRPRRSSAAPPPARS